MLRKSEDKLSEIPIPVKETEELPKRITLNRPPSASAPKIETQPKNERGEENALKYGEAEPEFEEIKHDMQMEMGEKEYEKELAEIRSGYEVKITQ